MPWTECSTLTNPGNRDALDDVNQCPAGMSHRFESIPSGFAAEVMGRVDSDSLTVDMQHGAQDDISMVQCFQALNRQPVTLMARVPWAEPGIIGKALNGGAYGIICPMANTPEAAAALVTACRYVPLGERSNGPIRVGAYGAASTS